MRKLLFITGICLALAGTRSCNDHPVEANFEDMIDITIYDYILENEKDFSHFKRILEAGGIDRTISAYNPEGLGYTLFLPTNDAIDRFIAQSSQFSSLDELVNNREFASIFARYHTVNLGIKSDDFPFGALPEFTLSGDILTVGFVVEPDTSYFSINNQAPVIKPNIEASNGWVHVILEALVPVTNTTLGWLQLNSGYSIFLGAVEATGFTETLDLNMRDEGETARPFTLLVEHDTVFNKRGIHSFAGLAADISPGDDHFTDPLNPMYNFVGYHLVKETRFLDDFAEVNTNYETYSDIPLNINGLEFDLMINKGKQHFDTIISGSDTTFIDYIGFNYDRSNVLTQSGSIHFIDQVLRQVRPSRAIQTFEFYEEPLFTEFRQEPGEYLVEDTAALLFTKWTGPELFFVEEADPDYPAWGSDYLFIEGDFSITYTLPKIVQGNYQVFFQAESFSNLNALVEVFIDGRNLGGLINLTTGGSSGNPFVRFDLGTINFLKYESHTIRVRSLIPGRFLWDYIRFEPR
ncbi:MAG: hypothetical protein EHM46_03495 [Bacteroidetes bacterium]|nr:MAG: hypothetical protein EHM46_03495 [Bacteroidota bacterium]